MKIALTTTTKTTVTLNGSTDDAIWSNSAVVTLPNTNVSLITYLGRSFICRSRSQRNITVTNVIIALRY